MSGETTLDFLQTWQMVKAVGENEDGCIELKILPLPAPKPNEAVVKIAGCGVCGSDISFFYHGVRTIVRPPITLGHEISGTVVGGDEKWIGKEVIVPTIIPCRDCDLCDSGRSNRCLRQKMPGNNLGKYGGYSSHIVVPGEDLCPVPDHPHFSLAELAVIADAVSTPYQAAKRVDVKPGDRVVIIGVTGSIGLYMAQWAKFLGAEAVVGIGRNPKKLERSLEVGCDFVINSSGKSNKEIQKEIFKLCRSHSLNAKSGWKIFETSGIKSCQDLALTLLGYAGTLIVVGYGTEEITYNISRLSPFEAEIIGTWGCKPEYYPETLQAILDGHIKIKPFVEEKPMSQIREIFQLFIENGSPERRTVLVPDFNET